MHLGTRRVATTLAVGVALLGISAAPALAGPPTPSAMKMPAQNYQQLSGGEYTCFIATKCGYKYWQSAGETNLLVENYGYVKSKKAAKAKLAEIRALTNDGGVLSSAKRNKYTDKYTKKNIRHKTKIETYRFTLDEGYGSLILTHDLLYKKGKLIKRVSVGMIIQAQETRLSNKLYKNKGKIMKKQMRKLSTVAQKNKMSGPMPGEQN